MNMQGENVKKHNIFDFTKYFPVMIHVCVCV